jgi:hypothetical protein
MTTFNKIWQIVQARCGVTWFGSRNPNVLFTLHLQTQQLHKKSEIVDTHLAVISSTNFLLQFLKPSDPLCPGTEVHNLV